MARSPIKSDLDRIKRKFRFDRDSFEMALRRHQARLYLALYADCRHAPGFDPRRFVEALDLLEGDTATRWKKDQAIIIRYYAKHPRSLDDCPYPEWGLSPEEMRENHARYYWGEDLDDTLAKLEDDFKADYPDNPPLDGKPVKHGPGWVIVHWPPEIDIEMQEMEDLISDLEKLEGRDPCEELENPETSWLLRRGRHLLESFGGPTLEDLRLELTGGSDGTQREVNQSPPTDA